MTNEKALEIMDILINPHETDFTFEEEKEAYEIAIEALKKQIPKKPINEPINQSLHYKLCPRCNRKISGMEWGQEYCWSCGQAIDWQEDEK